MPPGIPVEAPSANQAAFAAMLTALGMAPIDTVSAAKTAANQQRSAGRSRKAYDDSAASLFREQWADLTGWAGGSALQVSGGALFANSSGASTGGINHSFAIAALENERALFDVDWKGGVLIVGVSDDAAGAVPTSGANGIIGLRMISPGVATWNKGTQVAITSPQTTLPTGRYMVAVTVDPNYVSVVAALVGSNLEFRSKLARPANVNNLSLYLSDANNLAGTNVRQIAARKGIASFPNSYALESQGRTVHLTTASGADVKVVLPANYDSRVPCPLAVMFHGNGSTENVFSDNAAQKAIYSALSTAGYALLSVGAGSYWGAQAGLAAYAAGYASCRDNFNVGPVVFVANSMGGIESLNVLNQGLIPGVMAWFGWSPTYNLAEAYANATFTSTIKTAYGIASDGSDYATKTAGHDPALMSPTAFRGVPMMIASTSDDAVIPKATNGDALAAAVAPYALSVTNVTGLTGGHSFDVSSVSTAAVNFLNAAIS